MQILTEPRNALIKQYQRFFDYDHIDLDFTEDALWSVADKALVRETGARGLRSIIENALLDVMFELPSRKDVTKCVITKETIEKHRSRRSSPRPAPDIGGPRRPRRRVGLSTSPARPAPRDHQGAAASLQEQDPLRPRRVEQRWQRRWDRGGLLPPAAGRRRSENFVDLRAAAERHRRAAHGPRAQRLDAGLPGPLAPDARLRHALAARLRPRRHLDPERRREAAARRGQLAPGDRAARRSSSAPGPGWRSTARRSSGSSASSAARLDYARERFTMDDGYVEAVMRFFAAL